MFDINLNVIMKLLFTVIIVILVSIFLLLEAAYHYGLKALPENTSPSKSTYSQDLLYTQWVDLNGRGDIEMKAIYPVHFVIAFVRHSGNDKHFSLAKGSILADRTARVLLFTRDNNKKVRRNRHINKIAIGFWISRNWTAHEALNTLLDLDYYGNQLFGIQAAAYGYFKKLPEELSLDEVIYLVALTHAPSYYECKPERIIKLMNRLRTLLSTHYPKLYAATVPIKSVPASDFSKKCKTSEK
ncbi:MAG: hypothetical protein GQ569_06330 [Methylococcaceae bacterium]|nr:hypothetical protein [Methylococcaceae bacterium]